MGAFTSKGCCGLPGGNDMNSAFVFIKPHAVTADRTVESLVRQKLASAGVHILRDAKISAEVIDEKRLIDKHYGAIASRAVLQKPSELVVQDSAKELFLKTFGLTWEAALSQKKVFNSADAASELKIATFEVGDKWGKLKNGAEMIKFGGGFYVGKIDHIFVVNGFYIPMRAKFTKAGTCIHYFEVEWDPMTLPWDKFRADVIGGTNPAQAATGSIRNTVFHEWSKLGLPHEPNTGDNGVHASAGPFEGLVEKANWLGVKVEDDAFGRALISSGITKATIEKWSGDPPVLFEGKQQSLFDLLEDLDARACLEKAVEISTG